MLNFISKMIIVLIITLNPFSSIGNNLAVDLSSDKINIDSDFNGIDLLIFGSKQENQDLIILVKGKKRSFELLQKQKIYGIWLNKKIETISDAESFYYLATTKPLDEYDDTLLRQLEIGIENIRINTKNAIIYKTLNKIFYDLCIKKKIYILKDRGIEIIDDILFKENLSFPHNITLGRYTAQVFLFKNNKLEAMRILPIQIEDQGMGMLISKMAQRHYVLYALFVITIGMIIGWVSAVVFKKS